MKRVKLFALGLVLTLAGGVFAATTSQSKMESASGCCVSGASCCVPAAPCCAGDAAKQ